MKNAFDIVMLGLSVTSSWGNGHATTYRSLIRGLAGLGYRVLFLERNLEWYAQNRDEAQPCGATTELYESFAELTARFEEAVAGAKLAMVGSFVPDGARVGEWVTSVAKGVTAFYDIDTPVTLGKLETGGEDYITPDLVQRYGMYLSFTGGPALDFIERRYGTPMARALYCSVDPEQYPVLERPHRWDLGYLGSYSEDRQPGLDALMLQPARLWSGGRFVAAGPMYPEGIEWPENVERIVHLSPREHAEFYASQRFTLNITRAAMKRAGFSPSVRLFEAGACGVPVISDYWEGLDGLFAIGKEVLISRNVNDTLRYLRNMADGQRRAVGAAARARILAEHTPEQRARQLEGYLKEAHDHFSADSARRNQRNREIHHGVGAGLAAQRGGEKAGGAAGAKARRPAGSGGLFQPAGARR